MEPLCDPVGDRKVKTCKAPPHKPLRKNMLFPDSKNPSRPSISIFTENLIRQARLEGS
jgi:serine/threonine-protein phosphatase 2B catalytic subunit